MKLAFLGLGKMGSRMVKRLLEGGHEVVVWNRSLAVTEDFAKEVGNLPITVAKTLKDAIAQLTSPRVIWMMLPAGGPTEDIFQEVVKDLHSGDILIDGGNAYYKDTQRRFETLRDRNIHYLGIGVSGGIKAVTNGFPLMVGGNKNAYEEIMPILKTFAHPHGGYEYFGEGGAGHFVKMVHNGIEYGMMQAIGEGFGVLEKAPYTLDLVKVANIWQKGTIISSFLIDCAKEMLEKDVTLSSFIGPIGENGEATWTIQEAEKESVEVPVIRDSLKYRLDSKNNTTIQNSYVAKMVSALRNAFGGHEVKKTS